MTCKFLIAFKKLINTDGNVNRAKDAVEKLTGDKVSAKH